MTTDRARILLTASRTWIWVAEIYDVLQDLKNLYGPKLLVVHGDCGKGGDAIAEAWCRRNDVDTERHPADWALGAAAGPVRNAMMVNRGAMLCVAFSHNRSAGTVGCCELARRAGIPIMWYERFDDANSDVSAHRPGL